MTTLTTYTITSSDNALTLRDCDGAIVGTIASSLTIRTDTDSDIVIGEIMHLIPGEIVSIDHDRDEIHVTCDV